MRNKTDNPPPATVQASPASPEPASPAPLVFHPSEWASSLRDEVLQTISRVGGNKLGLAIVNRDLRSGLLEGTLVAPDDSTRTPLSRTDWERRTVHAMHNPAEGVYVMPYEAGHYFVRRAGLAELTPPAASATPADRQLRAEGGSEPAAIEEAISKPPASSSAERAKPPRTKPANLGGAPETWDWPDLAERLRQEPQIFKSPEEFIKHCRKEVLRVRKNKPRGKGPKTPAVKAAIHRHKLDKSQAFQSRRRGIPDVPQLALT